MRKSIVRNSLQLIALNAIGQLITFLMLVKVNSLIGPQSFGIFQLSLSLINLIIIFSSAAVYQWTFFVTKLVEEFGLYRSELIIFIRKSYWLVLTLFFVTTLGLALLFISADWSKVAILLLIMAIGLSEFVIELHRAILLAMHKTFTYGVIWVLWMLARFALVLMACNFIGGVSYILAAMFLSSMLVICGIHLLPNLSTSLNISDNKFNFQQVLKPFRFKFFSFKSAEYVLLAVALHIDIVIAYFKLTPDELGEYSASTFAAKALAILVSPISQLMVSKASLKDTDIRILRLKTLVASLSLIFVAQLCFIGIEPLLCGSRGSIIANCNPSILNTMLFVCYPITILRVLISSDLNNKVVNSKHLIAVVIALIFCVLVLANSHNFAHFYVIAIWLFMFLHVLGSLNSETRVTRY